MLFNKETYNSIKERRLLVLLLFFIFSTNFMAGQTTSPKSKLKPEDIANQKKYADSLMRSGKAYIKNGVFKKAMLDTKKSLIVYKELENGKYLGNCYNQMATIYYYQSDFSTALMYYEKSEKCFQKTDYLKGVASSLNNQGAIYYYLGDYPRALENYKKAAAFHQELNDETQIAVTTQNIGGIYLELNDLKNAKKHFETAKNVYKNKGNIKELSQVLNSIGDVYMKEGNYDVALVNFENSLELATKNNEKQVQTEVRFNLGKLYEKQKEYIISLTYYNQSLNSSKDINSSLYESNSLIAIGGIKLQQNKKLEAIRDCSRGLEIAEELNVISIQEEACKCLYESYKSTNQLGKALFYNEQMHLLKDSLNLKQTTDKVLNMEFEKQTLLDSIAYVEKERKVEVVYQQIVEQKEKQRNIFIIAGCFALIIAGGVFSRLNFVKKSKASLQIEKDRSEHLLLNILPEEIAQELKEKGFVDAQDFETATILFTDFKSFTETASQLTPQELVEEINVCFKAFDNIMEQYNVEKIKTIGDAYMAAGGLPQPDKNAVKNTILAAIAMQAFVSKRKHENEVQKKPAFEMRVGIHDGPIVAGIVGVKKFQYDIWGDTVNTASRMESNSKVGKVNISHATYVLVKEEEDLVFEYRGKVAAKGKGELEMYFVTLKT